MAGQATFDDTGHMGSADPSDGTDRDDDRVATATATSPRPAPQDQRARRRLLAFPVLATLVFGVLVALGWNQSSSAMVRTEIEGTRNDPGHVFGSPNLLRFDEWMVTTSFVVSQDSHDYPQVNPDAMGGTDVSVTSAVPYRDWSTAFRPQSWGFFFLPFDQAFAFYWWLPVLVLALGTYALLLSLRPGRPVFAAAGAATMFFAPFVQWWLLTGTLACLAWAAIILASFVALGRPGCSPRRRLVLLGLITFSTAAFLMLMYPPFQLACGWVVVAGIVGWTWRAGAPGPLRDRMRTLVLAGAAGAGGVGIYALFLATRWDVVSTQLDTEYPGGRQIASGSDDLGRFFSGFLGARLQTAGDALPSELGGNASETSSFVYLGIFLTVPALWLLWRSWRRERQVDGLLVALLATLALFASFLFVDGADVLARATGLSAMEPARLYIGVGLLSLLLTAAVLREMDRQDVGLPGWLVGVTGLATLLVSSLAARWVGDRSPELAGDVVDWLPLALVVTAVVVLAARRQGAVALAVLAVFSFVATYRVHPVRDGVYDTRRTEVGQAVVAVDQEQPGRWIAIGTDRTQALLTQQPVDRRSGIALYPVMEHWDEVDPTGENLEVYNRYAFVAFVEAPDAPPLWSPDVDNVFIRLDPCGAYAQQHLDYILADHGLGMPCLEERREIRTPVNRYYIYEFTEP